MSSIPHFYQETLEKIYKETIFSDFSISNFNSYLEMMDNLQVSVGACVRKAIVSFFEKIDNDYCKSMDRKSKYYYSGTYSRTLVTIFGEIQFKRKYYYPKDGGEGFFYVDNILDIPKYDCYDMIVKAMIMKEKADKTYALAAKIVMDKISEYSGQKVTISRQLAYQVFNEFDIDDEIDNNSELLDEKTVYIILDEKYVHTKDYRPGIDNKLADKMVKHAILYTGKKKEYKDRYKLINRVSFSNIGDTCDLVNSVQSYIDSHFIYGSIKNLIIAGDGASWILSFYKDITLSYSSRKTFVLDEFHVGQALCRITKVNEERELLCQYLNKNKKNDFINYCNTLINIHPEKKEKIESNRNYIIDRWYYIQNIKNELFLGCPMEAHISHDLAKILSRDPKAYSVANIPKHIKLRDLQLNGKDIKKIYLYSNNHIQIDDSFGYPERLLQPAFLPLINPNNRTAREIAYGDYDL